ncbi:MAG: hypothetical protein ACPGN3_01615 [Opitutales bacterium]
MDAQLHSFLEERLVGVRERMRTMLDRLTEFTAEPGADFASLDDYELYYWVLEMRAYLEKDILPKGVQSQLRVARFPFTGEVKLTPELASKVKRPRYKYPKNYDL